MMSPKSALRAGASLCETVSRASLQPRRCFSISSPRQGHVIAFTPTSSPELDGVLATIRDKIVLPSYLRQDQQQKLYRPKYEQKLRRDPITMEIDGEVLKFYHVDMLRDLPNTRRTVFDAVSRMRTREDFANLAPLLEGLRSAGRRLQPWDYARMARRAGDAGCISAIIECARMVRTTGFRLDTAQKVGEVLAYVQAKAVDGGWDARETAKALAWAELVVDMLEDEKHRRRKRFVEAEGRHVEQRDGLLPLARDPQVVGALLHLAAALAVKHHGGADADGKVARYASDLISVWPPGVGLRRLHPPRAYEMQEEAKNLLDDNKLVVASAPLMHGMDMAMQVVDTHLAAQLMDRRAGLAAEVEGVLPGLTKGRGRAVYEAYFGAPSGTTAEQTGAAPA